MYVNKCLINYTVFMIEKKTVFLCDTVRAWTWFSWLRIWTYSLPLWTW